MKCYGCYWFCLKLAEDGKDEKSDEDCDDVLRIESHLNTAGFLPQDAGKTTEVLDAKLKDVNPRSDTCVVHFGLMYIL